MLAGALLHVCVGIESEAYIRTLSNSLVIRHQSLIKSFIFLGDVGY